MIHKMQIRSIIADFDDQQVYLSHQSRKIFLPVFCDGLRDEPQNELLSKPSKDELKNQVLLGMVSLCNLPVDHHPWRFKANQL